MELKNDVINEKDNVHKIPEKVVTVTTNIPEDEEFSAITLTALTPSIQFNLDGNRAQKIEIDGPFVMDQNNNGAGEKHDLEIKNNGVSKQRIKDALRKFITYVPTMVDDKKQQPSEPSEATVSHTANKPTSVDGSEDDKDGHPTETTAIRPNIDGSTTNKKQLKEKIIAGIEDIMDGHANDEEMIKHGWININVQQDMTVSQPSVKTTCCKEEHQGQKVVEIQAKVPNQNPLTIDAISTSFLYTTTFPSLWQFP